MKGFIIYTDHVGSSCTLDQVSDSMDRAGVLGMVSLGVTSPPGLFTFRHHSLDKNDMKGRSTTLVEVFGGAVGLEAWRESSDLIFRISPPHDETYYRPYTNPLVIICLRVLIPPVAGVSFVRAIFGYVYIRNNSFRHGDRETSVRNPDRRRAETARFGKIICTPIAFINFAQGLIWASGFYSNFSLPFNFYMFFLQFLMGRAFLQPVCLPW
mmetsp:Transcript_24411/g.55038  ORF Transcript_24411/g.55038 Transcript_24411/m.55038 type:complete len:211 (+) Transcript_24411:275-907(+)